jgi:lipopolysaccharide transport system ATP-binding protein
MSDTVISFENIIKQYRLGMVSTRTLSHDLNRLWHTAVLRNPDPYLMISETNNRAERGESDYVWALYDINFSIKAGDVVGIIGKNGSGKSTLLKILSRITAPTTGVIRATGRIAALLEVGTGFHPELTGRENVFLNGAILGMKKSEISRKFDEIVDFAGVERYIDTPVKRYSSGMRVRLGFAVAAHLEPEILIVDEVLAVGDAEFQKKAISKMQDISRADGRTVIFVSHNMTSLRNLCNNGVLLNNGAVQAVGAIEDVVDTYLQEASIQGISNKAWNFENAPGSNKIKVKSAGIVFQGKQLSVKTAFDIEIAFWCLHEGNTFYVSMLLYDQSDWCVFNVFTDYKTLSKGEHKAIFHIPENFLNDSRYYVKFMFVESVSRLDFILHRANTFEVHEDRDTPGWNGKWTGAVRPTFIEREIF